MTAYGSKMRPLKHSLARTREDQIVLAAETCFQRFGFHSASMAKIADEAGMSVGQIYRYFSSKDALITTIVERDMERSLAFAEAAFAGSGDKIETLLSQIASAVDHAADPSRAKLMLEIAAEAARNPNVAKALQAVDIVGRERFRAIMTTINGPDCDLDEIDARIEVLSLLFEGLPWRLVRNPAMKLTQFSNHLRELVRGLLLITPPAGA